MSERGCIQCGYNLAGLPAAGTVVTCPECGQQTDLSVPPPRRTVWAGPALWGMVPGGACVSAAFVVGKLAPSSTQLTAWLLIAGPCVGAISAGVLMYRAILRERERGLPMRPLRARVGASVRAAFFSLALYAWILLFLVYALRR